MLRKIIHHAYNFKLCYYVCIVGQMHFISWAHSVFRSVKLLLFVAVCIVKTMYPLNIATGILPIVFLSNITYLRVQIRIDNGKSTALFKPFLARLLSCERN